MSDGKDESFGGFDGDEAFSYGGDEADVCEGREEKQERNGRDQSKNKNRDRLKRFAERLKLALGKAARAFRDALFPPDITCDVCGEELTAQTRYRLCAECTEQLPRVGEHVCLVCGAPITDEADYCIRCQYEESAFLKNRSPLVYDGKARELIHKFKFGGKKYIAQTLGAMMADEYLKRGMHAEIAAIVPMTHAEEKSRGYNQSELLANEIADRLKLPLLPALVKTKDTASQKKLTGKERAQNLKDAFTCTYIQVKGRKVLLIDDVFTTGATANACAEALIKAGAREVCVLTAAVTKRKIPVESNDGKTAI